MSYSAKSQEPASRQNVNSFTPVSGALLQRKCACGGSSGLTGSCSECEQKKMLGQPLQTKLRINEPGDAYEQEADRMAEQVMRMAEPNQDSDSWQHGATANIQRRIAGDGVENIQRQEEAPSASGEPVPQTEGGEDKEEDSRCPRWRQDPQSISKRAAENYARNDMNPPSQATVEKIDCEPPRANGNYGCYVHFSDGLVIRVIVRAKDIVVGTGPGPFTTLTPPPGTPLCFYDYHCPEGLLVLTKRECKSAKPAASSGPTLVGQRRAAPGASGALDAAPAVGRVLETAGQSLDAASRSFFAARFGHDFANVRVHADAQAAESARSVGALAYTVGSHVVFGAGQYAPNTSAGKRLLAHELTHVVQQSGGMPGAADSNRAHRSGDVTANNSKAGQLSHGGLIQRQPEPEPKLRDLPLFLDKLELNVGKNLLDYGHHLYQAAALHPDEPEVLQEAFSRYALGLNVLKTSFRYAGFKGDTADKLAVGTGILFKGLSLVRKGEVVLDFQVDLGRGVKFETNVGVGVNPDDPTKVRKADIKFGFVRRF
jgi:uncharacterized protein DUF4157